MDTIKEKRKQFKRELKKAFWGRFRYTKNPKVGREWYQFKDHHWYPLNLLSMKNFCKTKKIVYDDLKRALYHPRFYEKLDSN